DREDRGYIPTLQVGLDDEIDETECDQCIGVAIAAIARQAARPLHAPITRAELFRKMEHRMRGADESVGKTRAGPRFQDLAAVGILIFRLARNSRETLTQEWLIENPHDGSAFLLERDKGAPERLACD